MPQSLGKVLGLLELLQAAPAGVTVGHLAARLGVDERTVRRYAAHLADLGIPVEGRRGRYGGYALAPGYRLPPLMLTDEETLAVLLGLIAGRRTGLATTAAAGETALAKIQRVLPATLRARTDALLATLEFATTRPAPAAAPARDRQPATAPPPRDRPPATETLLTMAAAARDRSPIAFTYAKPTAKPTAEPTEPAAKASAKPAAEPVEPAAKATVKPAAEPAERRLDPFGLVFHAGKWFVTGRDHDRAAVRTFRLDRVSDPRVLPGTFEVPPGFDPAAQVAAGLATAAWRHEVSVLLHADLDELRRQIPPTAATLARAGDDVRLTARAERLDGMARLLAGLGCDFTVETPDALRTELTTLATRLRSAATRR
ncbi:YafY family protein [Actinoplanes sp. L3-i22]|uniref:helix-turn-helix transcriptional regulator n=1 Tax=Actinoplanes sp. L3-i22 TaxID=2836373 RepID=UPI001C742861|nr:WYL domain-containing protein [Actinoplanes sp. L3-i22]BCY08363.1 transcriptional regulator [Actinoplanes sp. L3-i22]